MRANRKNAGKSRVELLIPQFIRDMGDVQAFGAEKYDDHNWKRSLNTDEHDAWVETCKGCAMRHLLAVMEGEEIDPESGMKHTAHAALNLMYIQYYHDNDRREVVNVTL